MHMRAILGLLTAGLVLGSLGIFSVPAPEAAPLSTGKPAKDTTMHLEQNWDKTFPQSDKVTHQKVTFQNRYGITLAADLYRPRQATGKMAAIAVSGPFGAVKEQASGLYAQTMAERGFLTLAFDPSFTGESGGRTYRHHRHLRLWRHGDQCRHHGHPHQGHGGLHHVRHEPRHRQRLL